jgi:hypothetical protein
MGTGPAVHGHRARPEASLRRSITTDSNRRRSTGIDAGGSSTDPQVGLLGPSSVVLTLPGCDPTKECSIHGRTWSSTSPAPSVGLPGDQWPPMRRPAGGRRSVDLPEAADPSTCRRLDASSGLRMGARPAMGAPPAMGTPPAPGHHPRRGQAVALALGWRTRGGAGTKRHSFRADISTGI